MSRNKQRNLPSSGSGAGANIKPKQKKNKYVTAVAKSLEKSTKGTSGADAGGATPMDSDTQAYKQIGDAGESIALENKRRRAAKATDSAAVNSNVA